MQKNPSSGPEGDWNPWKGCGRKVIRCISLCQIKCAHPSAVATPCEEGRSQNKLSLSITAPHQEAIQYPLTQTIWWLKVIKVILFNLSTQSASSHAMDMLRPENYIFTVPLHQSVNATMALSHTFPASGVDWLFGAIFAIRNSSTDLFCPKMCWNVSIRVMSLVRLFLNTVFLYPSTRFIYIFDRSDLGNIVTSMLCIASQIIKRVLCEMCL